MASLAETLRRNQQKPLVRGAGGQLTEETPDSLQQLTGQAGMQASPTTPIGAGMIGANPDQQKMAGTPAQIKSALSKAQKSPDQTLQGALRRGPVRSQATGQEQQEMQKSADMQNLGSLGDRVTNFINTQRQSLTQNAGNAQAVEQQAATQFQGKDITNIASLLQQLQQNPTDQNVMLQVNQALGYDINTQLDPAQVSQLYQQASDAIGQGAAGQVSDSLSVQDLVNQGGFGYDTNQLSQLLGVPAQQIAGMNVAQLRNEIARVTAQEMNQTGTLNQQAQSTQLGQAERAMAQQAGKEASRTGLRSSEADMQRLNQSIANADQVQFGGQSYKVDDLLKDDTISGIVSDYLNAPPGSDTRNKLDQSEPGLSQFIKQHEALLDDAAKQMSQGAQSFQETQQSNQALASQPFGGQQLDPTIAAAVIPGYGTLQAQKVDPNSVPLLQYVTQAGPGAGATISNELNAAVSKDSSIAQQLQGLNAQDLASLGIEKGQGSNWSNLQANKDVLARVNSINPQDADSAIQLAYSDVGSKEEMTNRINQNNALKLLRLPGFNSSMDKGLLDTEGGQVINQIRNSVQIPSLKDAAQNGVQPYQKMTLGSPQLPTPGSPEGEVFSKVGPIVDSSGHIPLDKFMALGISGRAAQQMIDSGLYKSSGLEEQMNKMMADAVAYTSHGGAPPPVSHENTSGIYGGPDTAQRGGGYANSPGERGGGLG